MLGKSPRTPRHNEGQDFPLIKALCISVLVALLTLTPIIHILNLSSYNSKFHMRGPLPTSDNILIVAIDNESIDWLMKWPWTRRTHAKLVDLLKDAGAKLIIYDVFFDSPTQFDPQDDIDLATSIKRAGNVLLASSYQKIEKNAQFQVLRLPFKKPIPILNNAALDLGVVHPDPDADSVVRRFQLVFQSKGDTFYALGLQAVRRFENNFHVNLESTKKILVGKHSIPLYQKKMLINYHGPSKTFKTIPFARVFDPADPQFKGEELKDHPEWFKDKIVLIGASALELHDVFSTPFDKELPGVEIHANVIETILKDQYIEVLNAGWVFLSMILISWVNIRFGKRMKIRPFFGLMVFQTLAIYIASFSAFIFTRLEMPTYTLLITLWLTFLLQTIIKFVQEEKEKKKVRDVFSQYVAPSVVNEILSHPESIELGGEMREVTIFFSDIRGFTTFSEAHTPKEVVELLNEYLDAMTQVIFEFGGTLDKYVGDEIMAIFGAPLPLADHPRIAVACAIAQMKKLRELQQKWRSEGKTVLDIGMGLNTGTVVVGNIGSTIHKDYTVIGDAVNLAARIESLTRTYSDDKHITHLLISEDTYLQVKDYFECQYVDEITVKGKLETTKLFEVLVE